MCSVRRRVWGSCRSGLLSLNQAGAQGNGVLRFLLRTIGLFALAGAFAATVIDGARSLANDMLSFTTLGAAYARMAPANFGQLPARITKIRPFLWDPLLLHVLYVPLCVLLALIGLVLMILGKSRQNQRGW
jgi:hypothetical protein